MQPFIREQQWYDLGDGATLVKAQEEPFLRAWVAYRGQLDSVVGNLAALKENLAGVPFLYWLEHNGQKLAGMVILPNGIGDFFLIPPERDAAKVLALIWPLLDHWSDAKKPIQAQMIADEYISAFLQLGFAVEESMRRMIRPVSPIPASLPDGFSRQPLDRSIYPELARLLKEGFVGNPGEHGRRTLERWQLSVDRFWHTFESDSPTGRASGIVLAPNGEVAALLICDILDGLPSLRFIATMPAYRRQGLATVLMAAALDALTEETDWYNYL